MRKLMMLAVLMAATAGLSAIPGDLERVIDFDVSIRTLSEYVQAQEYDRIDTERHFILEGVVASIQVFDPEPQSFQAIIEIVSSNWVGVERIEVHRVYVLVEGPQYAERLPERLPTDPDPRIIRTNQRLLVVGPYIGTATLEAAEVPVVLAAALR